jgi:hypothetical protein
VLSVLGSAAQVEARLSAGAVRCPGCGDSLSPWGWARSRVVRTRAGARTVRPRRARCQACAGTHVLLPAGCVPLRRDSAEVIGAALLAGALGVGHRRIAADLGRPAGTVRGWLRRARRRSGQIRTSATRWADALDPRARGGPPRRRPARRRFRGARASSPGVDPAVRALLSMGARRPPDRWAARRRRTARPALSHRTRSCGFPARPPLLLSEAGGLRVKRGHDRRCPHRR